MSITRVLVLVCVLASASWIGSSGFAVAEIVTESKHVELTDETDVYFEVDFGLGELTITSGSSDTIIAAEGVFDDEYFEYEFDYRKRNRSGDLYFDISDRNRNWDDIDTEDNEWTFMLSNSVPFDLSLDVGAAACDFELGGLMLSRMDLNIGAADCEISFDTPNLTELEMFSIDAGASSITISELGNANFRELEFSGGVGSCEIDFSGEFEFDGEAEISIGLGSADITIPDHVGVRIYYEDEFLSSVDIPRKGFTEVRRDCYESDNWDTAKGHLEIRLDVGLGSVDIRVR